MSAEALCEFIGGVALSDAPAAVRRRVALLLSDIAAVCIAGRGAPASAIAADHAPALGGGAEATALLDGRRLGAAGAAWANGVLANALDFDDGHRLTKGHPGAVIVPAALAAAQLADANAAELTPTNAPHAQLAAGGFTSARSEFVDAPDDGLGSRWRIEELYVKAYPCCRWSQGAIAAVLAARAGESGEAIEPTTIERVEIRTFAAADGLAKVIPSSTEEAQYNLVWPVASALVRGRFAVADVLGPFDDPEVASLVERVEVIVDPQLTAAFPARRLTTVEILLRDGRRLTAGPLEAPGEPDDPDWEAIVARKRAELIDEQRDLAPASTNGGLRELDAPQLLGLLCGVGTVASVA